VGYAGPLAHIHGTILQFSVRFSVIPTGPMGGRDRGLILATKLYPDTPYVRAVVIKGLDVYPNILAVKRLEILVPGTKHEVL
jgi:hypothetical protein